MSDIQLYDATLRDGMGGGGLTLTAEEKIRVVRALDALGVHMVEAGFPASNPKEQELFGLLERERLTASQMVAFGMTRRREVTAAQDEGLRTLADCFAPVCTIVGKASVLHVEKVVRVSREENLRMIAESVAFLADAGKRVLLDAEHFFDGFAADPGYALDCLRAASDAGAERLVLCDTNGGSLPPQIRTALAVVAEALPGAALGIHTHNDSGCARRQHAHSRRSRRDAGPGHRQRHRRAHGQRQPRDDHRRPAAEDGLRGHHARAARHTSPRPPTSWMSS